MTTALLTEMDSIHLNWCQEPNRVQVYRLITDVFFLFGHETIYILHKTFELSARNNPFFLHL